MPIYRYFVSYLAMSEPGSRSINVFGNMAIDRDRPIRGLSDVRETEAQIARLRGYHAVTLDNFRLFDSAPDEAPLDEGRMIDA